MKVRKKPVIVEAHRWWKNGDHPDDSCQVLDGAPTEGRVVRYYRDPNVSGHAECEECGNRMHEHGWIDTPEGGHRVCPGDWIITGVRGEYYPCKPDIFAETYEPVEP